MSFWKVALELKDKITLDFIILENPKQPSGHETKLPFTCIWERGNHLGHGRLPSDTGQAIVIREQEPVTDESVKCILTRKHPKIWIRFVCQMSPDRQCTSCLFRQFGWIDKHQFEEKLQVANLSGKPGADDPRPVPALSLTSASKVHQNWSQNKTTKTCNWIILTRVYTIKVHRIKVHLTSQLFIFFWHDIFSDINLLVV